MAKKATITKLINTENDETVSKKVETGKKTNKKAETKIVSKAKTTEVAKQIRATATTKKTKIENEVEKIKPVDIIKTKVASKAKKKPEDTVKDIVQVQDIVKEVTTKKRTKKTTEEAVAIVPTVEVVAPKKRVVRKKSADIEATNEITISKSKEKNVVAEDKEVTTIVPAEKPKRTTKKIKIDIEHVADTIDTVPQIFTKVQVVNETKPAMPKAAIARKTIEKKKIEKVTKVFPVNQPAIEPQDSTTIVKTTQAVQPKKENKKDFPNNKLVAKVAQPIPEKKDKQQHKNAMVSEPSLQSEEPKILSKSARRRAKKKAKKLREQTLLVQANITTSPVAGRPLPSKKQPETESVLPEQVTSDSKMWDKKKHKGRSTFISNSQQNTAPIYSTQDDEKINVVTSKAEWNVADNKTQYVSHRKLQPKPIPWADLSKFKDEKKPVIAKEQTERVPVDSTKLLTPSQRRDPFFQNFYREVEKFVMSEMLVENGSKVLVAVSGGVDSVVMLDVFANLSAKYNFIVYVAHYNHNIRGDASENDAKFVKSIAAAYNLPFYTSTGKVLQHAERTGMSIEESARFLRYYFLERTACTLKADFVVTAHNSDDSAETFLLNLFRGTGLTGLSGIPSRRQMVKDVIIIRPFLNFSKQKLKEYAEKRDLEWREDETNLQDKYTRNKIRNSLIPKLKNEYSPAITDIINRSAKLIQGADHIIHNYVRTHLTSILFDISNESISIKLTLFKTFDEFIRGEMLQTILMKYFKLLPMPMKIIDRIIKLEQAETGAICEISKNIIAIKDRQTLMIAKKITPNKINQKIEKKGKFIFNNITFISKEIKMEDVEFTNNPCVEYLDADLISNTLLVRNWEHGDDFIPLGMKNTMKLSDFLINEKVSVLEKPNVLVVINNNHEIVWVCKHRLSNKFKVTENTKKVLRIEIKENK